MVLSSGSLGDGANGAGENHMAAAVWFLGLEHRVVLTGHTSLPADTLSTSWWVTKGRCALSDYPRIFIFFFPSLGLLELFHLAYWGFNYICLCRSRKRNVLMKSATLRRANSTCHATSGMTVCCALES